MDFVCPTCAKTMPQDLQVIIPHTEEHIIDVVKKEHPDWVEKDGLCKRCHEYYKDQFPPR